MSTLMVTSNSVNRGDSAKGVNSSTRRVNASGVDSESPTPPLNSSHRGNRSALEESKKSASGHKPSNDATFSLPVVSGGAKSAVDTSHPKNISASHPSLALSQQARKKNGTTTMVLYLPGANRSMVSGVEPTKGSSNEEKTVATVEEGNSGEVSILDTISGALGNIPAPHLANLTKRPIVTAVFLFLYFLLIYIFLLSCARKAERAYRNGQTEYNQQLITFSSSLYEQYLTQREGSSGLDTDSLEKLERMYKHSVHLLHQRLVFPGSVGDVDFLIKSHVMYNRRVKKTAVEELEWVRSAKTVRRHKQASVPNSYVVNSQSQAVPEKNETLKIHISQRTDSSWRIKERMQAFVQNKLVIFILFFVLFLLFLRL